MHTSGLVITFTADPVLASGAQGELTVAGPFTLGEARGPRQAVTLETTDPKATHDWHDWAEALSGVENVEVVFVHWDDENAEVAHAGA